jgi:DNA-3-methyladenine glycosylase II
MVRRGARASRRFARSERVVTSLRPPTLSSLPAEREQLEYSSRSMVFPTDGPRLLRAWGPPERPNVVAVDGSPERWRITAWGLGGKDARAAVRAMFSLDHPLEEFYRLASQEPVLAGARRRFRGLRIPRDASLYEAIVHAVLGQQLSVRAASTIKARLIERTGSILDVEGVQVPHLPGPSAVAALGHDGLRSVGVSGAKARSLLALAQRESDGAFGSDRFRSMPVDDAVAALDEEPGVGRWTAENALLRGVGRRELFIAGDLGLRVALDRFGAVPRSAPEEAARAWGDRNYPGWGSYATLYLWRRLVSEPAEGSPRDPAV